MRPVAEALTERLSGEHDRDSGAVREQRLHVLTAIDSAVKKGWFIRTAHSL